MYGGDEDLDEEYVCSETEFSISENTSTEELADDFVPLVILLMKQVLWAFNCEPRANVEQKVLDILQRDHLV